MSGKLDLKGMLSQGHSSAAEEAQTRAVPKAPKPAKPDDQTRVPVGTRMRRDLHRHLKSFGLELEDELDRRVSIEELLEALVLELKADAQLQARVTERCRAS